jgi:uncharacterized protein (DUF1499 family)
MTCINVSRAAATLALTASALLAGCSSSPVTKGVIQQQLGICPSSPNCVSSHNADDTHKIAPLKFTGSKDAAKRKLVSVLGVRKDTEIKEDNGSYLWVTFRSPTMGFIDDGEFLVKDNLVEVRSASRTGYSDFGKNRSRMEEIRKAFEPCCD